MQQARALIGRRKRWLRRAALLLAGLVVLSAFLQLLHRRPAHLAAVPVVVTRREVRPGEMLRENDLEIVASDAVADAHDLVPAAGAPFTRAEEVIGRIAPRGLHRGERVAPENTVPVLEFYGVSARVPPGMRAVNLVVPSAAVFGGELTPQSRVDIVAAFALGQERAATTLLSSGIVLRVTEGHSRGGPALGLVRPNALSVDDAGIPGNAPAEVEVAIPASREREVVLAQAFGRIFLAVHSAAAGASSPASSGALPLRRYLELPLEAPPFSPGPPPQTRLLTPPANVSTAVPRSRGSNMYAPGVRRTRIVAAPPRETRAPLAGTPHNREKSNAALWTVEVIGGGARSIETVPRVGESAGQEDPSRSSPSGRSR